MSKVTSLWVTLKTTYLMTKCLSLGIFPKGMKAYVQRLVHKSQIVIVALSVRVLNWKQHVWQSTGEWWTLVSNKVSAETQWCGGIQNNYAELKSHTKTTTTKNIPCYFIYMKF